MSGEQLATAFKRSEEEAKAQWLRLLTDDGNVPIDVAFRSTCEIKKEYYPYAEFHIRCKGKWSATSIWEHEEEYQVAREETVYIDYQGKEHKDAGYDREWDSRRQDDVKRYRQPMSRTVYETKTKTVIDQTLRTSDSVGPLDLKEYEPLCDIPSLAWVNGFSSDDFVKVTEGFFDGYDLITPTVSDDEAEREAQNEAVYDTAAYAKRDVPGDRYEDFYLDRFSVESCQQIDCYLAVFHIIYQYDGDTYHCYLSGSAEEGDYLFGQKPVDESIKERAEMLEKQVEKNGWFSRKTLFLLGALLLFWIGGILSIFNGYDIYAYPFEAGDVVNAIVRGTLSWACYIGVAYFAVRFVLMQITYSRVKKEKERFEGDHTLLRKQVLDLVNNDAISDEEKKRTIDGWLASHSDGLASGKAQAETVVATQKKRVKLVNILAVALVAIALAANIAMNVVAASGAAVEQAAEQTAQEQRWGEQSGTYEDEYADEQDAGYEWDMA